MLFFRVDFTMTDAAQSSFLTTYFLYGYKLSRLHCVRSLTQILQSKIQVENEPCTPCLVQWLVMGSSAFLFSRGGRETGDSVSVLDQRVPLQAPKIGSTFH